MESYIISQMEAKDTNISREMLYEQVWKEPISKLAVTYRVSGTYIARICRELKVPTPGRGYWAKLSAGKNPPKDALPKYRAGDPTMWIRSITSSRFTDVMPVPPKSRSEIPPQKRSRTPHGFLLETKELFSKSKKSSSSVYLKPRQHRVADILTTSEHLEDAISLSEKLFSRIEDYGYRAVIANKEHQYIHCKVEDEETIVKRKNSPYYNPLWRPAQCTVAYLGTVAVGIAIVEMTEEVKGTGYYAYTHKAGSGRFRIYAYSPYRNTELIKHWQDTKEFKLAKRLDEIIGEIEEMARNIPSLITDGEKRAEEERLKQEAERQEYRRKKELELRAKAKEESRTDLDRIIQEWGELKNRQAFVEELSQSIDVENPETRAFLIERLEIAKILLKTESVVDIIKSWKTPEERFESYSKWQW